jgi:hypothetical protein
MNQGFSQNQQYTQNLGGFGNQGFNQGYNNVGIGQGGYNQVSTNIQNNNIPNNMKQPPIPFNANNVTRILLNFIILKIFRNYSKWSEICWTN